MADDIIVMYAGQIVEEGSVDEIFNNPSHPYTRKLLEAVPKLNMNRNEALSAIEGTPPDLYKPPLGCAFFDRCDEAMVVCEKNIPDFYNIKKCHCSRCFKKTPFLYRNEISKWQKLMKIKKLLEKLTTYQ